MNRHDPSKCTRKMRWPVGAGLLLLVLTGPVLAQEEAVKPAKEGSVVKTRVIDLDEAIRLALGHQPNIHAARASLNSALTQRESAYSPMAVISGPVIHVRRQQADAGVSIAHAAVEEAELNTIHAVTRAYLTVLYAKEQMKTAQDAAAILRATYDTAKSLVDAGSAKVTTADLTRINTYVLLAESRVVEAEQGIERAMAALREAIGLPCDSDLELAPDTLGRYYDAVVKYCGDHGQLSCKCAVDVALKYRPELLQANLAAELAALEIQAQGWSFHIYSRTFAATADIHSKILPATVINDSYRPGPLGPEMPAFLAGSRTARMTRAGHLYDRASAAAAKAKELIILEVEDACHRLHEEATKIGLLRQAVEQASKTVAESRDAYRNDLLETDVMLSALVVEAQTKAQLNDALYGYGKALAALQRATAGKLWHCVQKPTADAQPEKIEALPKEGQPQ